MQRSLLVFESGDLQRGLADVTLVLSQQTIVITTSLTLGMPALANPSAGAVFRVYNNRMLNSALAPAPGENFVGLPVGRPLVLAPGAGVTIEETEAGWLIRESRGRLGQRLTQAEIQAPGPVNQADFLIYPVAAYERRWGLGQVSRTTVPTGGGLAALQVSAGLAGTVDQWIAPADLVAAPAATAFSGVFTVNDPVFVRLTALGETLNNVLTDGIDIFLETNGA